MEDSRPIDRFPRSLLDRLTDDEQEFPRESSDGGALAAADVREGVRRDMTSLLNTIHLAAVVDLRDLPEVENSALNYGIPGLAGRTASTLDRAALARSIRRAIVSFEPRLIQSSLHVEVAAGADKDERNALRLEIEGELCLPRPLRLRWHANVNLENGAVDVIEAPNAD